MIPDHVLDIAFDTLQTLADGFVEHLGQAVAAAVIAVAVAVWRCWRRRAKQRRAAVQGTRRRQHSTSAGRRRRTPMPRIPRSTEVLRRDRW